LTEIVVVCRRPYSDSIGRDREKREPVEGLAKDSTLRGDDTAHRESLAVMRTSWPTAETRRTGSWHVRANRGHASPLANVDFVIGCPSVKV